MQLTELSISNKKTFFRQQEVCLTERDVLTEMLTLINAFLLQEL